MLCHSPLPFVRFPIQWRFYARSIRWLPIIKRQYTYSRLIASFVLTQQFQLLQIDKAYIRDWLFWTLATRLRGAPSLSYKALTHFIKLLAW